jgi:hypothetical protein
MQDFWFFHMFECIDSIVFLVRHVAENEAGIWASDKPWSVVTVRGDTYQLRPRSGCLSMTVSIHDGLTDRTVRTHSQSLAPAHESWLRVDR